MLFYIKHIIFYANAQGYLILWSPSPPPNKQQMKNMQKFTHSTRFERVEKLYPAN